MVSGSNIRGMLALCCVGMKYSTVMVVVGLVDSGGELVVSEFLVLHANWPVSCTKDIICFHSSLLVMRFLAGHGHGRPRSLMVSRNFALSRCVDHFGQWKMRCSMFSYSDPSPHSHLSVSRPFCFMLNLKKYWLSRAWPERIWLSMNVILEVSFCRS